MSAKDSDARPTAALHEGEYTVTDRTDLHVGGAVYRPGDTVALSDETAKTLLADGIVRERKAPTGASREGAPTGAKRKAAIRAAYAKIPAGDTERRTADGKARVKALEAELGFDITEAERDEAHAAAKADDGAPA